MPENTPFTRWLKGQRDTGIFAPAANISEIRRQENQKVQAAEIDQRLEHWPLDEATRKNLRQKRFDIQMDLNRAENQKTMPPTLFSDAEIESWKSGGPAVPWVGKVPLPGSDPRSRGGRFNVPLPIEDPRPRAPEMPPVQALDAAPAKVDVSGEVHGEVKQTIVVEATQYFKALIQSAENVVKLAGTLGGNGPGSAGHSSPDAGVASAGQAGAP